MLSEQIPCGLNIQQLPTHLVWFVNPKVQILASNIYVGGCLENPVEPMEQTKQGKIRQTNHQLLLAIPRPGHYTAGGGD